MYAKYHDNNKLGAFHKMLKLSWFYSENDMKIPNVENLTSDCSNSKS